MDGPQNTDRLNFVHFRVILTWTSAYAVKLDLLFFKQNTTALFCSESFHIYDIRNLISCPFKLYWQYHCIDQKFTLVVWYLKRWPGFDSQPESMLSSLNSLQLMIYFLKNFNQIFATDFRKFVQLFHSFMLVWPFQEQSILGYICKIVKRR